MRFRDGVSSRKTVLLGLTVLAISQARCGSKCGGFVPCVPDAVINVSPSQLTFGNQSVGTVSSPQTVTLSGTGMSASLISSITASGDFSQTNTCGKALAANTSCSVAVVFAPSATGTRTGQLVISQGMGLQIVIGLTGTGQ